VNVSEAPHGTDAQGLIDEARVAERAGRFPVARQRYEAALHALQDAKHAALASALLRWIGRTHESEGNLSAALDCYEVAFATAEACESVPDLAHVLNCYGILMFRRGRLDDAQRLYGEARELAESAGERKLVAMVDQNLGNVANVHGDHRVAHGCYLRSLRGYQELGLDDYVGPLLTNIGRVHIDLAEWDDAESVFVSAESSCQRSDNVPYQVLIRVHRTRLNLSRNDFEQARVACDDAMELSLHLAEDRWLGEIHMYAGVIMRELGRPAIAEDRFRRALEEAQRREELILGAEIRKEMASLFGAQQRNREMLDCLNQAHETFAQLRARRDLEDVSREIAELEQSFERIVADWGDSIESSDRYTQGHCERVADHACDLALANGLDPRVLGWFRMGALLHDVGKVDVPPQILTKPGPLDEAEWQIMKQHPERGVHLLADIEFPWDVRPMVLHHHEHWDGGGYPHGLKGDQIPIAARVLCVADIYDALTTTRSYRRAFTPRAALEIMAGDAGHILDPALFELFEQIMRPRLATSGVRSFLFRGSELPAVGVEPVERRPPLHAVA
jgi:HD-GYP domain-containing protein (c-di-GMP phosphodiesterase class II)